MARGRNTKALWIGVLVLGGLAVSAALSKAFSARGQALHRAEAAVSRWLETGRPGDARTAARLVARARRANVWDRRADCLAVLLAVGMAHSGPPKESTVVRMAHLAASGCVAAARRMLEKLSDGTCRTYLARFLRGPDEPRCRLQGGGVNSDGEVGP